MNESRSQPKTNPFITFIFIVAVSIAALGSIIHVTYRNKQIKTAREIEDTEKSIRSLTQDEIPNIQVEIDELLSRYEIREKIKQSHSALRPIVASDVEVIRPRTLSQNNRP
jgi:cell division protein FtsL